jgi:hypothetical protein
MIALERLQAAPGAHQIGARRRGLRASQSSVRSIRGRPCAIAWGADIMGLGQGPFRLAGAVQPPGVWVVLDAV